MDAIHQVCKYCKHAKPTGTDLLKGYINTQRIILKPYTHVLFVKGYPKGNKPSVEKEIVSISPSVSQRKAYAPTSGLILSFL